MDRFLWICLGGAAGTGARYLVGLWATQRLGTAFPWGTLIVNILGCFLLAFIMRLAMEVASFPPNLRFALTTGFMGGLTTYSTFNLETTGFFQEGGWRTALFNIGVTLVACFVAGLAGFPLAARR